LLVGTSSSQTIVGGASQIQVNGANPLSGIRYATTTGGPTVTIGSTRAASQGSFSIASNGDTLANLLFVGDDGTAFVGAARITAAVDGTPGTNDMPGRLVFSTTADGASSPTERMRITSAGNIGIGTTSPSQLLTVSGGRISIDNAQAYSAKDSGGVDRNLLQINAGNSTLIGTAGSSSRFLLEGTGTGEAARIDSSGRLLVGTSTTPGQIGITSPTVIFSETGTQDNLNIAKFRASTSGPGLQFNKSRGAAPGTNTVVLSGDELGRVRFAGADGTNYIEAAQIGAFVDGTPGTNDMPGRLVFSTTADGASSPTERMRITENGSIYFQAYTGTPPSTTSFGIAFGRASTGSTNPGRVECYRNVDGTQIAQQFGGSAGQVYIKGDGDLENTNNSYTGISDIKLKENIINAGSQWDDLKALQVRKYNFKAETGYNTHTQIGLVAQEVELVSPGLVGESIDEETGESTKSVNYSVLYMKAVKALQEAMERIETLEASNADLLARVSVLEQG
jgi:hypothetical protein